MHWRTALASRTTSNPLMRAVPSVGGTSVVNMRMRVDLPAPLGPSKPKISPFSTLKFKWSTAHEIAEALGQVFHFDGEHGQGRRGARVT